jgi:hypothetical protein
MFRLGTQCRSIFHGASQLAPRLVLGIVLAAPVGAAGIAQAQEADKHLDIQSSVANLHAGNDGDARETGLPLYPGARLKHDQENKDSANLGLFSSAFGIKLVVANYDSDDSPAKVVAFYRDKLKKYGKVLECRSSGEGGDVQVDEGDRDGSDSKELKCDGDNSGKNIELKAGSENNQRIVAIQPEGNGSSFALVYFHVRGKEGSI